MKIGQISGSQSVLLYRFTIWNQALSSSQILNIFKSQNCGGNLKTCAITCNVYQYYNSYMQTCLNCEPTCPYCTRWGTCSYCSDILCDSCDSFVDSCTAIDWDPCIDPMSLSMSNSSCCSLNCGECYGDQYYECSACRPPLFLLAQVCVKACPLGFTTKNQACIPISNYVLNMTLDTLNGTFTFEDNVTLTSGNNTSFYSILAINDPIPSFGRGYYFTNTSIMRTNPINISYNFTLAFWIKILSPGIIYTKSLTQLTTNVNHTVVSIGNSIHSNFTPVQLNKWTIITLQAVTIINGKFNISLAFPPSNYTSYYITTTILNDTLSEIIFGNYSNSFVGFLWRFQLYTWFPLVSSFTTYMCLNSFKTNCYWDCNFTQYLNNSACSFCKNECDKGCVGGTYCNLCNDPRCYNCSDYFGECYQCIDNAWLDIGSCQCNELYYWDIPLESCQKCSMLCYNCTGPSDNQCTSCRANNYLSNSKCICENSFYFDISINGCTRCNSTCLGCTDGNFYSCISCYNGLLLFNKMCVELCPIGYFNDSKYCYPSYNNSAAISYTFLGMESILIDSISNIPCLISTGMNLYPNYSISDPIATSNRGLYFRGNGSYISFPKPYSDSFILFGPNFYISIWINPSHQSGTLFYKNNTTTNKDIFLMQITKSTLICKLLINSTFEWFYPLNTFNINSWNNLLISVSYDLGTAISITTNKIYYLLRYLSVVPFVDILNSSLIIGAYQNFTSNYQGFIYGINIYTYNPNINELVVLGSSCQGCDICPGNTICYNPCNISSFNRASACIPCKLDCLYGCTSSNSCNLCNDVNCYNCSSFGENSCKECYPGYELQNKKCAACNNTSYYDPSSKSCLLCTGLCVTCYSIDNCTSCINNSYVASNDSCQCIQGYHEDLICIRNYFYALLTISSTNSVTIIFSEPLELNLTSHDIKVYIGKIEQTAFTLLWIDVYSYLLTVNFSTSIIQGTELTINFTNTLISSLNSELFSKSLSIYLFGVVTNDLVTEVNTLIEHSKNGITSGFASAIGLSMLNLNPNAFFNFLNAAQIYSYIALYQVEVDPLLIQFLSSISINSMFPSFMTYVIPSDAGQQLNSKFTNFGYNNNIFLLNSGVNISILICIVGILPIICALKIIKNKTISRLVNKTIEQFKFSVFLRFFIQSYLDFLLNSFIGMIYMTPYTYVEIIDVAFSVLIGVINK